MGKGLFSAKYRNREFIQGRLRVQSQKPDFKCVEWLEGGREEGWETDCALLRGNSEELLHKNLEEEKTLEAEALYFSLFSGN